MMDKLAKNREKRNGRVKNIDERDAERIKKIGGCFKALRNEQLYKCATQAKPNSR